MTRLLSLPGSRGRRTRPGLITLLVGALSLVLAACSGSGPAPTGNPTTGSALSPLTQINEAGQAKIAVTWQSVGGGPTFAVAMDTHVVDLDGYDLRELALLRTAQAEVAPSTWDAPKGGHHRSGTLSFPPTAPDGGPLIGPTTRTVELVIRGVAGVPERVFQWAL